MKYFTLFTVFILIACNNKPAPEEKEKSPVERYDSALDALIDSDAKIEVIATGYEWSEGPVWVAGQNMLLFSDVPKNTVYKWTAEKGAEVFLTPSGYMGSHAYSNEPGSNGLLLDDEEYLILCQHGERRIALMDTPIGEPKPNFVSIADNYQGKKFNSPNDACFDKNYNLYFTDPPYGLPKQMEDSTKELPYQGVYKVSAEGKVTLLVDSITRPNGIALSPDNKYLYVANSDGDKPHWYRYELGADGIVSGGIFYDASKEAATQKGSPDGMKVDKNGNLFCTGPGGISIINPAGKLIGKIRLQEAASNCALADDDKTLYVTNDMQVVRVRLRK